MSYLWQSVSVRTTYIQRISYSPLSNYCLPLLLENQFGRVGASSGRSSYPAPGRKRSANPGTERKRVVATRLIWNKASLKLLQHLHPGARPYPQRPGLYHPYGIIQNPNSAFRRGQYNLQFANSSAVMDEKLPDKGGKGKEH